MKVVKELHRKIRRASRSIRWLLRHPLARRNKIGVLLKYVGIHLLYPLLPGPVLYPWIENVKFILRPGMAGINGNVYAGLADFEEMSLILHVLRKGDLFIDVGANVGAYTLLASGVCDARSIAIEPVPSTFQYLVLNMHINGFAHIGIGGTKVLRLNSKFRKG